MARQCSAIHACVLACALAPAIALAHPDPGPEVTPATEREQARHKGFTGPVENRHVLSVTPVGQVDLGPEFAGLEGRVLRAREVVVGAGGVIAVHEHDQRPGMAYILEGEIVEHRNDHPEPLTRRAGDAAFERSGVVHWWENRTDQPVRALVVDIVPE